MEQQLNKQFHLEKLTSNDMENLTFAKNGATEYVPGEATLK